MSFEGLKEKEGTIAVPLLINKLEILQNLNYLVGECIDKRPFKTANFGARKKTTLGNYTLIVEKLEKGSSVVSISPMSHQTTLFPSEDGEYQSKGANSLGIIHKYVGLISEEEDPKKLLSESVEDKNYRNRIGKLLSELSPKEDDTYKIRFENDKKVSYYITREFRAKAMKVIDSDYKEEKDSIYCPVISVSAQPKNGMKSFTTFIDGKKHTVFVAQEFFDKITENIGCVVEIKCNYTVNEDSEIIDLFDVSRVIKKNSIDIWDICYRDRCYNLRKPLKLKIESSIKKSPQWILKNEDLEITAMDKDWTVAYTAFNEEFDMLIREYVFTKDNLSPGAEELKTKLLSYIGGKL